jgi:hypothetical protein
MKFPRSFSLLTLLMLFTIAGIVAALYRANHEVARTRADFKRYSEEMGFIDVMDGDESKLHIRRLAGYPLMSFGFRYYLPAKKKFILHVGSGVADPETGLPPVVFSAPLTCSNEQGTLVVNLEKLPTKYGTCWIVDTIIDNQLSRRYCQDPDEFTWLQTYLSVFSNDQLIGRPFQSLDIAAAQIGGHSPVAVISDEEFVEVFCQKEFHPSAVPVIPKEMLEQRKIFQVWLAPIEEDDPEKDGASPGNPIER